MQIMMVIIQLTCLMVSSSLKISISLSWEVSLNLIPANSARLASKYESQDTDLKDIIILNILYFLQIRNTL